MFPSASTQNDSVYIVRKRERPFMAHSIECIVHIRSLLALISHHIARRCNNFCRYYINNVHFQMQTDFQLQFPINCSVCVRLNGKIVNWYQQDLPFSFWAIPLSLPQSTLIIIITSFHVVYSPLSQHLLLLISYFWYKELLENPHE